jgi:hypothetical protein
MLIKCAAYAQLEVELRRASRDSSIPLGNDKKDEMIARLPSAKSTLAPMKSHAMFRTNVVIAAVMGALLTVGSIHAQVNVEQIITQKVQPILPKGGGGGVAAAVRMDGWALLFSSTAVSSMRQGLGGKSFTLSHKTKRSPQVRANQIQTMTSALLNALEVIL